MTFNQLQKHLVEVGGCTVDPLLDGAHLATNCISPNMDQCVIERLGKYSDITLCHYFYVLRVPAPTFLRTQMENYRHFREVILVQDFDQVESEPGEE